MLRNAGGVITDDVIRSLAISQRRLGTRERDVDPPHRLRHADSSPTTASAPSSRQAHGRRARVRDRVVHRRRRGRPPIDPARPTLSVPAPPRAGARVRLRRRHPPPARGARAGALSAARLWSHPISAGARRSGNGPGASRPDARDPRHLADRAAASVGSRATTRPRLSRYLRTLGSGTSSLSSGKEAQRDRLVANPLLAGDRAGAYQHDRAHHARSSGPTQCACWPSATGIRVTSRPWSSRRTPRAPRGAASDDGLG